MRTLLCKKYKLRFKILLKFCYVFTFLCVRNSNTVIKKWLTRFVEIAVRSSVPSRNKHKKKKGHQSENNIEPNTSFNEETKLFHCQTNGCATTAKCKYNIVKHLKSCYSVNKNRRKVADNNFCKGCGKEFSKMSNRPTFSTVSC